jgi:3-oxoacyl-[acyl-carrier protein] reductase
MESRPVQRRPYLVVPFKDARGSVAAAELSGRVALVTGGGRGIGASIARELAQAGMRVAVAARTRAQIVSVGREIGGLALEVDVSDEPSVARMVEATERELGPIDLLVNNAGVMTPSDAPPIWEESPADWWRIFEVNVLGAYLCCHAVTSGMVERGRGRIVNVGSNAGHRAVRPGNVGGTAYGASKAALHRFSEVLADQLGQYGVSVFTIAPGLVRTALTAEFGDDAPWTPPELAPRLVRVLASGRADSLSGRYIHAEQDIEDLIARSDAIVKNDTHAIRLRG